MTQPRTDLTRIVVLAAVAVILSVLGLWTAERLGASRLVLGGASLALLFAVWVAAGLLSGTMRLEHYVTGGRDLPGAGVALAGAAAWPLAFPQVPPLAAALGFALAAALTAPALRRSGAPTWPTFLETQFGSRRLRVLAAVVVAAVSFGLGTAALAIAAAAASRAAGLSTAGAAALLGVAVAAVVLPGGARGHARAAVVGGLPILAAGLVLWLDRAGQPAGLDGLLGPVRTEGGAVLALATALAGLVSPALTGVWAAAEHDSQVRGAALWSAALVVALALAAGAGLPAASGGPFGAAASDALAIGASLVAASGLLFAAGAALAFDAWPGIDRRRVSKSRRFAQLRAAVLLVVAAAAWAAGAYGSLAVAMVGPCLAVLTGALVPPVLLAIGFGRATPAGAIAAAASGLAAVLVGLDGRLAAAGLDWSEAALVGCAAALALGVAVSLVTRPAEGRTGILADDAI